MLARWLEPLRIAAHVIARYARIEGQVRRFEATVDACAEATGPDVLARARAADLADRIDDFLEIRTRRWNDAALADAAAMVTYGLLGRRLARPPFAGRPSPLHALLKGLPDLASAKPVEALWALSRTVQADPGLAARIATETPERLAEAWQAGELGAFGDLPPHADEQVGDLFLQE